MAGEIEGLRELDALLAALPDNLINKVLRGAAKEGAKVIAAEAALLVPVEHGDTRESIGVGSSRVNRDGTVSCRIRTKGPGAYKAPWLEWGTAAHLISVPEEQLPDASTSKGVFKMSIRAVNRAARRGSLIIDGKFVDAVHHPGARPHPFMGQALENKRAEAVAAAASYIRARLNKAGLAAPAPAEDAQ